MTIYFDRQAKDRSKPKARWWIYTVAEAEDSLAQQHGCEQRSHGSPRGGQRQSV